MENEGEAKAEGVLKSYLEDANLVEFVDGEAVSLFEHVDPEEREPNGFFDYVLQTFADFASDDMGGPHLLEFSTDLEAFDRYAKISRLNVSLLTDSIINLYGFDFEDKYYTDGFNSGNSQFGQSLSQFTEVIPYDGKINTHNGLEYEKGLTEEQINNAIELLYEED